MITTAQIESIGWVHRATSANGGSKLFGKGKQLFVIENHSDNFIYKKENDKRLNEIEIKKVDSLTLKFIPLYKGEPKDLEELQKIISELGIE